MEDPLLGNPWIQFYLVYVGVLSIAFIWARLHDAEPPAK
jgi:hypothetical protein